MRIGEDQAMVLNQVRQTYQVESTDGNSYVIADKNAPGFKEIGVITFADGHLVSAGATWGETFSNDGVKFAKALVAAIENQGLAGAHTVVLRPIQASNAGTVTTGFELLIGNRTIDVTTAQTMSNGKPETQYARVMETLHNSPYVVAMARGAGAK